MQATKLRGREFGRLWVAHAASVFGTWLGFGAFSLISIIVLHTGPGGVSVLAAAGPAVGALMAVPFGPLVEVSRKRITMIAMDLARFAALISVPIAFALDLLSFVQLLVVSTIVAAANVAFTAASGAYLKAIVPRENLIGANGRLESTTWTATMLGPPLGGAAIGYFGPVTTIVIDAVSYLISALGIYAIGGKELPPTRNGMRLLRVADVLEGWWSILTDPGLRPLFFNVILVNGLIMASAPLMAVLMLGRLGFTPGQYCVAFGVPCIGGLVGSRMAQPLVAKFGQRKIMLTVGALRACWPLGLAFIGPGSSGLMLVIAVQLGLITCCGVFNLVFASYRLNQIDPSLVARTLSAWSISNNIGIAAMTALWGVLASITSPRIAIAVAGVLLFTTPLLLRGLFAARRDWKAA